MTDVRSAGGVFGEPKDFDPRVAGEFEVFVNETERLVKRAPETDLSGFDDHEWQRFRAECERDAATRELGVEPDAAPLHAQRLRSERIDLGPQPDSSQRASNREKRIRAEVLAFAKSSVAAGETLDAILAHADELSPSTATVLRQLVSDGEL
jgi:hypothetical protein